MGKVLASERVNAGLPRTARATLASLQAQAPWPETALDEAWRTLLLAQHHDCWIVPYNGHRGNTWADKVRSWTDGTRQASEEIIGQSTAALLALGTGRHYSVVAFNTLGTARTNLVSVALPADWPGAVASVWDHTGRQLASQMVLQDGQRKVLFAASAPALGYRNFWMKETPATPGQGATAVVLPDGGVRVETDYYRAQLDPIKGGTFRSLVAKQLGDRELVEGANPRRFNEIRGYFFKSQRFESSADIFQRFFSARNLLLELP